MGKTTSRTGKDSFLVERIFGDSHYKTTISDGGKKVEGRGNTSKESQKIASDKWDKSGGGSSSKSSGGSSNSGCYLTTACVRAMGLPDDCLELNVLRNFRDRYLMSQPSGIRAVKEYYRIAPEIVQCIDEREDAQSIWQATYRDIGYAVSLILSRDFEGAFKHYQQMTSRFQDKYLD
ncbi:MAG: hypothetical protein KJ968_00895 [Nanoarchaeota archaeon]|nr:hypothetical protein [Nanoarchaeota archaeon]